MPKNTQLTNLAVNTEADAFAALMNGGFIDIYDGTQPATGDTPLSGQTLGVSLTFGSPAFAGASGGIITANSIGSAVIASSINPATWARIYRSDHVTKVMDVTVGTANANIIVPTTNFVAGVTLGISSFTHTVAKATTGN